MLRCGHLFCIVAARAVLLPCTPTAVHMRSIHDAARVRRGVLASALLPAAIQALHTKHDSGLTFVFESKVSGIPSTTLWDSGAATSFVDSDFVSRHKLHVYPSSEEIALADGTTVHMMGAVKLKLAIQRYTGTVTLQVLKLTPGFDMILGDDWSTAHRLLVDCGAPKTALPRPAFLKLRSKGVKLYPDTPVCMPCYTRGSRRCQKCNVCVCCTRCASSRCAAPRQCATFSGFAARIARL